MSTKRMTLEETARFLGVSDRTVRNYIRQGFLVSVRVRGDRKHWFDTFEVEAFRQDRKDSSKNFMFTKKDFTVLRAQVTRLRSQMEVVMRVLDAKDDPLRMPPGYAKDLFELCMLQSKSNNWETSEVQSWLEVFLRIDEDDFQIIAQATEVRKPWKPFLSLCVSMTAYVCTRANYDTSLELQALHKQLAEARKRLRVSALIHAEMYSGMDSDIQRYVLADTPSSMKDTLSRVLKHRKK